MADVRRDVPGPIVQLRRSVGSRATWRRRLAHETPGAALIHTHTHRHACNNYQTVPTCKVNELFHLSLNS